MISIISDADPDQYNVASLNWIVQTFFKACFVSLVTFALAFHVLKCLNPDPSHIDLIFTKYNNIITVRFPPLVFFSDFSGNDLAILQDSALFGNPDLQITSSLSQANLRL